MGKNESNFCFVFPRKLYRLYMVLQGALLWPFLFLVGTICLGTFVVLTVYSTNPNPPFLAAHQYINQDEISTKQPDYKLLSDNQVPSLSQQKCFEGEYCNCPKYNGSYDQCTNNYKHPFSDFCQCNNRNFELCPFPFKFLEGKVTPGRVVLTEENFTTIPHQPLEPLFMDVPKTVESPNKMPYCE